jgi:hypothetical protein
MSIFELKVKVISFQITNVFYITQNSLDNCSSCIVAFFRGTVYTFCLPLPVHLARFAVVAHRFKPPVYLHCFALSSTNRPESVFLFLSTCLQLSHWAVAQTTQHFLLLFVRGIVNTKTRFVKREGGQGSHFIT